MAINFETLGAMFNEEEVKVCVDCGCIIEGDDYFTTKDGDIICRDCYENDYFTCEDCGEIVSLDYCVEADGWYVCESCLENNFYYCDHCEEYHRNDDREEVRNYGMVCEDCRLYSDCFCYCEECGEWVHYSDYDYDNECCRWCVVDRIIKPYHYHKGEELTFYGDASNSIMKNGYLGPEWEIDFSDYASDNNALAEKIHDILGDRVVFEQDCSVTGFESILMPHTYEELRYNPKIKEAFDMVKAEGGYNENTGLHIHISREAFGKTVEEQNENIAKVCMLHNCGDSFTKMVMLSRRELIDADCWAAPFHWSKETIVNEAKRYVNNGCGSHSIAINCSNRATVEFRLGKGTVDYDEFMAWVDIVVMIVNKSKEISFEDATNFDVWFEDANNNIKAYMERMNIRWNEPKRLTAEDYKAIMVRLMDSINTTAVNNGASAMDYNTLLYTLTGADEGTRRALGYM